MSGKPQSHFHVASPDVSTRLVGDEGAVLFHPDTGMEKFINPTGLFIWERLDGSNTPVEIADSLAGSFQDAPRDKVFSDLNEFLADMAAQGFAQTTQTRRSQTFSSNPEGLLVDMADAPKSIDLSLTGKCNLHCAYCFYHDEMQARKDLPCEEWITFFDELKRLGVRDGTLSGGEVFVRPDLWELIDWLIDSRMRYSILSNGTLVDEKTILQFEKGRRFLRLSSIQISIDGSCAEVHDKSRGRGSFEKAVRGLRLLKEAGFPVTVRVTVNRYNVNDLNNIARLLLDDIGLKSFSTNDVMPIGSGCNNQPRIALSTRQQMMAIFSLTRLAEQYNGRITATAGPLAKWQCYREMELARSTGETTNRWKMGYLTACGCVYNKISVHHDGIITPCNILAKLALGRINQDSITDVWKGHPILKALRDRRKILMNEVSGCEDCEWASYCNGSCPGLAYEMTGDFNLANPRDCYRRFLKDTGIESILDIAERR